MAMRPLTDISNHPLLIRLKEEDLTEYLKYLEIARINYRAELIIHPGDENAIHNLGLLERMSVEALARTEFN
jgi:hypothetical protein